MNVFYLELGNRQSQSIILYLKNNGYMVVSSSEPEMHSKLRGQRGENLAFSAFVVASTHFNHHLVEKCRELRSFSNAPILAIVQNISGIGRSKLLNAGVDDCMSGVIHHEELLVRLQKICTRNTALLFKNKELTIGEVKANLTDKKIEIKKRQISLTKTEYRIFLYLLLRSQALVKKEDLEFHAFPKYLSNSHALNMHVSRLRKKVEPIVKIKAVSSAGFMLTTKKNN